METGGGYEGTWKWGRELEPVPAFGCRKDYGASSETFSKQKDADFIIPMVQPSLHRATRWGCKILDPSGDVVSPWGDGWQWEH